MALTSSIPLCKLLLNHFVDGVLHAHHDLPMRPRGYLRTHAHLLSTRVLKLRFLHLLIKYIIIELVSVFTRQTVINRLVTLRLNYIRLSRWAVKLTIPLRRIIVVRNHLFVLYGCVFLLHKPGGGWGILLTTFLVVVSTSRVKGLGIFSCVSILS